MADACLFKLVPKDRIEDAIRAAGVHNVVLPRKGRPTAARREIGPLRAKVLTHERHRRGAERRARGELGAGGVEKVLELPLNRDLPQGAPAVRVTLLSPEWLGGEGIADLMPAAAKANLERVGWKPAQCSASSLDDALAKGNTHLGDDWQAAIKTDPDLRFTAQAMHAACKRRRCSIRPASTFCSSATRSR